MGSGDPQWWINYTKDEAIYKVLHPILTGQTILGKIHGEPCLLNLSNIERIQIYQTKVPIINTRYSIFSEDKRVGKDVTYEIMNELRFQTLHTQLHSFRKNLVLPPKHQIFVIMKFNVPELDSAYRGVVKPVGEEFEYKVVRTDDIEDSEIITLQIIEKIAESEVIYADLTGERPNCYFEVGAALVMGRELILSIKKGEKIHFDLLGNRFIKWSTEDELRKKLRYRLDAIKHRASISVVAN